MIIKNKLENSFGPFASSTGFFLMIGGLLTIWVSVAGIAIALVGAFVSFTSTVTFIDPVNRKIKLCDNLFGIIPCGKWIAIEPEMKLGLSKSKKGYRAYIRGTQPVSIHVNDIRIFLYNADNKQIMPLKKFNTYNSARNELDQLSTILRLDIV